METNNKKDQKTDERGLCDKKERRDWKPEEKKKRMLFFQVLRKKKKKSGQQKTTEIEDAENGTLCHSREMLWAAVQKKIRRTEGAYTAHRKQKCVAERVKEDQALRHGCFHLRCLWNGASGAIESMNQCHRPTHPCSFPLGFHSVPKRMSEGLGTHLTP